VAVSPSQSPAADGGDEAALSGSVPIHASQASVSPSASASLLVSIHSMGLGVGAGGGPVEQIGSASSLLSATTGSAR
jgi:hypothetical protein